MFGKDKIQCETQNHAIPCWTPLHWNLISPAAVGSVLAGVGSSVICSHISMERMTTKNMRIYLPFGYISSNYGTQKVLGISISFGSMRHQHTFAISGWKAVQLCPSVVWKSTWLTRPMPWSANQHKVQAPVPGETKESKGSWVPRRLKSSSLLFWVWTERGTV